MPLSSPHPFKVIPTTNVIGSPGGVPDNMTNDALNNVLIGSGVGSSLIDGDFNTLVGANSGTSITSGNNNTLIGGNAGDSITSGSDNICVGYNSGESLTTGTDNVLMNTGLNAPFTTGSFNVVLGKDAGEGTRADYNDCIFIGRRAGKGSSSDNAIFIGRDSGLNLFEFNDVTLSEHNLAIGHDTLKATTNPTNWNVIIGHRAAQIATRAVGAVYIGFEAGRANTGSQGSVFVGYKAGNVNTSGSGHIFIGHRAGNLNTTGDRNTRIGYDCGYSNELGSNSVSVGYEANREESNRSNYVSIGYQASRTNVGNNSVTIGYQAGFNNTNTNGVAVGYQADYSVGNGANNVCVGYKAGFNTGGSGNVMIGNNVGASALTGSNKLGIHNSDAATPLIYGEFDNQYAKINGTFSAGKGYGEPVDTQTIVSGAVTFNNDSGGVHKLILTENITAMTLTLSQVGKTESGEMTLVIIQDATGGRTITWPASLDWAGGTAPTLTAAANGVDVITLFSIDDGTTWYGFVAGQDMK